MDRDRVGFVSSLTRLMPCMGTEHSTLTVINGEQSKTGSNGCKSRHFRKQCGKACSSVLNVS